MRLVTQSVSYNLMVLLVDAVDHLTGKEGLTLAITASKAGGAFASIAPVVTERGDGWYSVALTASHLDTAGDLALHITASGADPADPVLVVTPLFANVLSAASASSTAATQSTELNSVKITTARAAVLTDLIDGGRLDLLVDGIKLWTDRLGTALEQDGAVYRLTTNALEQSTVSDAGAQAIAAGVLAARGEFYPNRSQVWKLTRGTTGIAIEDSKELYKGAGETLKVWVDFAGILGRNEFPETIDSLTVSGGTVSIVADSSGVIGSLLYVSLENGAASDVATLDFTVTTTENQTIAFDGCTLNVVE